MAVHRQRGQKNRPPSENEGLLAKVRPLAEKIASLQQEARRLGLFAHDRELLACDGCGLQEDVTIEGLLVTYVGAEPQNDVGLRFRAAAEDGVFLCPSCGSEVREPEAPEGRSG